MKIQNRFQVDRPVPETWRLLLDVPAVVPCVPGAELIEDKGNGEYLGMATVKIGPIQLQFRGTVVISDRDDAAHTAMLVGKGADRKGRGNASANAVFRLVEIAGGTEVVVDTDLTLTGAVAQYGRAEALIQSVAEEIIRQFAANLRAMIEGEAAPEARAISALSLGAKVLKAKLTGH